MKVKRYSFTLLEVLISLSLISLILALLFNFLHNIVKIEKDLAFLKKEETDLSYLQVRLTEIFKNLAQEPIYRKDNQLFFAFYNEIDSDPRLREKISGKLYLERDDLALELSSQKTKRKEILLREVSHLKLKLIPKQAFKIMLKRRNQDYNFIFFSSEVEGI